jgi:hypothetical protein
MVHNSCHLALNSLATAVLPSHLVLLVLLPSALHAICYTGPQSRSDAPAGLDASAPVEFQVLLLGFEREGYWQNLSWQQRWALADRLKAKGNTLFKDNKYAYASNR